MICTVVVSALAAGLFLAEPAGAQQALDDPKAKILIAAVIKNYDPVDQFGKLTIRLIHRTGQIREWQLREYYRHDAELQMRHLVLQFDWPVSLQGSTLMSINRPDGGNDQWFYFPSYRRAKRLTEADKGDYVLGSDLTFEDFVPMDLSRFVVTWVSEESYESGRAAVVKIEHRNREAMKRSAYGYKLVWIDPERHVLLREQMFDQNSRPFRTVTWSQFHQPDGSHWRAGKMTIFNPIRAHTTEVTYEKIEINRGLPDDFFSMDRIAGATP